MLFCFSLINANLLTVWPYPCSAFFCGVFAAQRLKLLMANSKYVWADSFTHHLEYERENSYAWVNLNLHADKVFGTFSQELELLELFWRKDPLFRYVPPNPVLFDKNSVSFKGCCTDRIVVYCCITVIGCCRCTDHKSTSRLSREYRLV